MDLRKEEDVWRSGSECHGNNNLYTLPLNIL